MRRMIEEKQPELEQICRAASADFDEARSDLDFLATFQQLGTSC
jgi:hypothetical protein